MVLFIWMTSENEDAIFRLASVKRAAITTVDDPLIPRGFGATSCVIAVSLLLRMQVKAKS